MPSLNGAVVLVTGANGGIGTHFVHEALERGAAKVYATARSPRTWDDDRIVPLPLDVTSPASIQAAVDAAPDVSVLINNAGVSTSSARHPHPHRRGDPHQRRDQLPWPTFPGPRLRPDPDEQRRVDPRPGALTPELVRRRRDLQRHQGGAVVGDQLAAPRTRPARCARGRRARRLRRHSYGGARQHAEDAPCGPRAHRLRRRRGRTSTRSSPTKAPFGPRPDSASRSKRSTPS